MDFIQMVNLSEFITDTDWDPTMKIVMLNSGNIYDKFLTYLWFKHLHKIDMCLRTLGNWNMKVKTTLAIILLLIDKS